MKIYKTAKRSQILYNFFVWFSFLSAYVFFLFLFFLHDSTTLSQQDRSYYKTPNKKL